MQVNSDEQLVGLLRARRIALGWTQGDLEHRVGWLDSYAAKLEAPHRNYGKRIASHFTHALFDWLTALGLTLVIMDIAQAEALAATSTAFPLDHASHAARAKFDAKRPAVVVWDAYAGAGDGNTGLGADGATDCADRVGVLRLMLRRGLVRRDLVGRLCRNVGHSCPPLR